MIEWVEQKIGGLAEITSAKRIFYSEYVQEGVPFYRSKEIIDKYNKRDINTELYITKEKYKSIKDKFGVPEENDLLLTSVGTLGIPYLVNKEDRFYFKDGNLTWFRNIDRNKLDPRFLFVWLSSSIGKQRLDEITIGSTQPALTIRGLKEVEILLPSITEQNAIVLVFSCIENKIDLLHRQNTTLEEMAETLFRQWFIEEAQDDWEEGVLADIADLNPAYQLSKGADAPYLEMSNVSNTTFNPIGWYYRDFTSGMKFKNGDTLLARITPCLENGKTCFVNFLKEDEVGWGSTEYIVIRMKEDYHPFISYILARNSDFRDFAISSMSGSSGRQRAQANTIEEYPIRIPPVSVIEQLNNQLNLIVPKLKNNDVQIKILEKLRDTLLPKLMSGEIRVKH